MVVIYAGRAARDARGGRHAADAGPVPLRLTGAEVYLKLEGANPTGSFKDRGMTVP